MACVALLSFTAFTILNNNKKAFKKLRALEGTWKMPLKKGVLCEEWKIRDKNYLQSKGYMLKGTDTIFQNALFINWLQQIHYMLGLMMVLRGQRKSNIFIIKNNEEITCHSAFLNFFIQ